MASRLKTWRRFPSCTPAVSMVVICALTYGVQQSLAKQELPRINFLMPAVLWDPRNPLFNCPNRGINTIYVRMHDYLTFGCPAEGKNLNTHSSSNIPYTEMFENAFITEDENAAVNCNATGMKVLLKCDSPNTVKFRTIRIAEMSGGDDPLFDSGKTYYIFGTATGRETEIDNRIGGRCTGRNGGASEVYKMILKIKTCSKSNAGTASCPICLTNSCYNKGCGVASEWNKSNAFQRKGNTCYEVYNRGCNTTGGSCDGPMEKLVPTNLTSCIDLNGWELQGNETFIKRNDSCYAILTTGCDHLNVTNSTSLQDRSASCNASKLFVKVDKGKCSKTPPVKSKLTGEENGTVSLLLSIFIICIVSSSLVGVITGLVVGCCISKRCFARPVSVEEHQLTSSRKSRKDLC